MTPYRKQTGYMVILFFVLTMAMVPGCLINHIPSICLCTLFLIIDTLLFVSFILNIGEK